MSSKIDGMLNLQIGLLEWNRSQPKPPITQGYEYGVATAAFDIFQEYSPPELAELQATIARLTAENDQLRKSDEEATDLCDTLSALLGQIAVAVRGPEEPKSRHGFSDLPSRVKTVVSEIERLKGGHKWQYEHGSVWWEFDAENVEENIASGTRIRLIDGAGNVLYQREASQPTPASIQLPERFQLIKDLYADGWNACLDKVKEMNQ